MVLKIKFETALADNEQLTTDNAQLNTKVETLSSNISNAETRSEKVTLV